jgi:hypothetical protein
VVNDATRPTPSADVTWPSSIFELSTPPTAIERTAKSPPMTKR